MNEKIVNLLDKYKNIILYAVFGVLTTSVNIVVYWVLAHPLAFSVMVSTIIAWIAAVLFAYLTNRKWVFHSQAKTSTAVIRELFSFFACRFATGIVVWGCMFFLVDLMHSNDVIIKAGANVLVIILNYVASKLIIFKNKK